MPDPRIPLPPRTLNEQLLFEAIRHAHQVEAFKKGQVSKIARLIDRVLVPSLVERLEQSEGLTVRQQSRIANQVRSFEAISQQATGRIHKTLEADLMDLGVVEADWQRTVMQRSTPINFTFNQPSLNVLEVITRKRAVRGRLLEDWFKDIGRTAARQAEGVLRQGLATGQTVREMVEALRGVPGTGFTGAIQQVRRQAATIVRTSVNHVANLAHEEVFKANKDVIKGVRWVSVLDRRTTDICISLDGQTWKVGEGQRPPAHHQCRSITVPVMEDWSKFGVDASKVPAATRRAMGGDVPANVTYQDWLKTQPPGVQNQVLGKGKAELFRRGIPVQRFVDKALKPKTIAQIINEEGLAGTNLTALRFAAQQRLGSAKAAAAERIRAAFNRLPEPLRNHLGILRDATAPIAKGLKTAALPIANAGPILSSKLIKATGASKLTVQRAMTVGLAGDWAGFFAAPLAPVLAAFPPGSAAVAAFGLGNLGQRALRRGYSRVANLFRSPGERALLEARARRTAAETAATREAKAKARRIARAKATRERNRAAREAARQRGEL